jgi:hypothetical protein
MKMPRFPNTSTSLSLMQLTLFCKYTKARIFLRKRAEFYTHKHTQLREIYLLKCEFEGRTAPFALRAALWCGNYYVGSVCIWMSCGITRADIACIFKRFFVKWLEATFYCVVFGVQHPYDYVERQMGIHFVLRVYEYEHYLDLT